MFWAPLNLPSIYPLRQCCSEILRLQKKMKKLKILGIAWDRVIPDLSLYADAIQVASSLRFHNWVPYVDLHFGYTFGRSSNLVSDCPPGQSSSKTLNLFDCRLPYEAFYSDLGGLGSLESFLQRWRKFARKRDGISQPFELEELDLEEELDFRKKTQWNLRFLRRFSNLQHLELLQPKIGLSSLPFLSPWMLTQLDLTGVYLSDEVIPHDINWLSSLTDLGLNGDYLTRLPSSLYQLSKLRRLILSFLSKLYALPKLPMTLATLDLFYCSSLEMTSYIPKDMWNSNVISRSIRCSVVVGSIGYDGKPYKTLLLHPQCPLWSTFGESKIEDTIACGPVLEVGIPKWFSERSINVSGIFRSPICLNLDYYLRGWIGYAIYIVYHVHDDPSFPVFVCELEADGYDECVPLVFCVPELPSVGVNGAWVFTPASWFIKQLKTLNTGGILRASISTKSLNVKVNDCWTRLVGEHDVSGFYDTLSSIYARRVDLHSLQELFSNLGTLFVLGPIKEKSFWLDDDDIIKTHQLEMPTCSNLILDQSWSSIPLERCLYLERASTFEDLTFEENQTLELDMPACLDQSLGSIHLRRCLYPEGDSTFEENQPKRTMALPRQEHLEMAELTDQERRPYQFRRCFRVQLRRQVKRRRRDISLQRDPSVGRRNEFVSSWQFWRCQFFLHGRRNSLAAVCLLFTAFALLVFSSWKISDLEKELCPT